MTRPTLSGMIEKLMLCISAAALAFTLTIAVKLTGILVDEWPALRRAPTPQTELAIDRPPPSKASLKPSTKARRRHARVARAVTVVNEQPPLARPVDADEINPTPSAR